MNFQFREILPTDHRPQTTDLLPIEQTFAWGAFQDALPDRHFLGVFGVFHGEELLVQGSFVLIRMEFSKKFLNYEFVWCKEGPVCTQSFSNLSEGHQKEVLKKLFLDVQKKAFQKGLSPVFIRFHCQSSPLFALRHREYIQKTLTLDLHVSLDELLAQMKQKGRYNIKVAEKKGVSVEIRDQRSESREYVDAFYDLLKETTGRDGFSGHPKEYYRLMLENIPDAKLYLAKYEDKYIAGVIVVFSKERSIYYYGASSNEYRNVMAPYLLQWQAIQDAKTFGSEKYDFLGISSKEGDSLAGVTQFKQQFGGSEEACLKVYEYPFRIIPYILVKLMRFVKKVFQTINDKR